MPKKKAMKIPKSYKSLPAFKKFKPKVTERLFESEAPPPIVIVKKEEPTE